MRKFGIPSAALVVTALWLAAPVSAAPAATSQTPFINTTHPARFVVFVVVFIALLWFGIVLYDRFSANKRHRELIKFATKLVNDAHQKSGRGLTSREAGLLIKKVAEPPRTAPGLTRTLLALGLLMLIGIALIALLVSSATAASDLLKTLVVALTSALTTILGFYFGAKTATDAAAPAAPSAPTATAPTGGPPGAPTIESATGADTSATVAFTPPDDTGGSPITGYTVNAYAGDTIAVSAQSATADPVTVAGLTNGADYTFTVYATNANGDGPESAPSATVTPGT